MSWVRATTNVPPEATPPELPESEQAAPTNARTASIEMSRTFLIYSLPGRF